MKFFVLSALAFLSVSVYAEEKASFIGKVAAVARNADGSGYFNIRYVNNIPGRYNYAAMRVNLCVNGVCPTIDPDAVKTGVWVEVTGIRINDFRMETTLSVKKVTTPVAVGIGLNGGEVVGVLPTSGGWQWLLVKSQDNKIVHLQICASYVNSNLCPVVSGNIRRVGAQISYSAMWLDDTHYWRTETVSELLDPNLTASLELVDFGDVATGDRKELNVKISNTGSGRAFDIAMPPQMQAFSYHTDCPSVLEAGQGCEVGFVFTPTEERSFRERFEMIYSGSNGMSSSRRPLTFEVRGNGVKSVAAREFRIRAGAGVGPWNRPEELAVFKVGETVRIYNDDTIPHHLHTNGVPCRHPSALIPPGGYQDVVMHSPYNRSVNGATVYDHLYGSNAQIYWQVDP